MSRRFCFTLDLKDDPVLIAEYRKYHENLWPEIIISPEGKHLGTIKVPETVSNVAWGN